MLFPSRLCCVAFSYLGHDGETQYKSIDYEAENDDDAIRRGIAKMLEFTDPQRVVPKIVTVSARPYGGIFKILLHGTLPDHR